MSSGKKHAEKKEIGYGPKFQGRLWRTVLITAGDFRGPIA